MNYKQNQIVTIFLSILLGTLLYIISYQYKNIEFLKNNYSNKQQEYSDNIEQKDNQIKYLNNEIIDLQEKCFISIERFFCYIEPLKTLDKKEYLTQYNNIINDYNIFDLSETIYDYYTEEEITYMWKCIETETFQSDFNSKVNVACVILNRIENENFPLDPIDIITNNNQFAYGRNIITEDTKLALEYAFMIEDTTSGCIAFRSDISPKTWNGWEYQFTDDAGHHFYK